MLQQYDQISFASNPYFKKKKHLKMMYNHECDS